MGTMSLAPLALSGIPVNLLANSTLANSFSCDDVADRALVLIQLSGGNDGLNTLIPVDQYGLYKSYRPNVAISDSGARGYTNLDTTLDIADQVGIQPDFIAMKDLYDQGKVQFIQDVSYSDSNKSHFKGTDIWLAGKDGPTSTDTSSGWMGRYLDHRFPGYPSSYPNPDMPDPIGLQLGSTSLSLGFYRNAGLPIGMSLGVDPDDYLKLVNGAGGTLPGGISNTHYGKELDFIKNIEINANVYAQRLADIYAMGANTVTYPDTYYEGGVTPYKNSLAPQLQVIAKLLSGGSKTKIFLCKHLGFDNHTNQVKGNDPSKGKHAVLLYHLAESIKAFQEDLKNLGLEDKVMIATFSEFGRTVKENGNLGTDHGNTAPMMIIGKGVKPGVTGTNPSLDPSNIDKNNFTSYQHDYRTIFTTLLQDWLGAGAASLTAAHMDSFSDQKLDLINSNYIDPNTGDSFDFVSDPICYATDSAFPVELLDFTAEVDSEIYVRCEWATASEKNNKGFTVQRSIDGFVFENLDDIAGKGDSQDIQQYDYLDRKPLAGKSFYRLKQVDFDGSFTYSEIRSVVFDPTNTKVTCEFYPNPVQDSLKVTCHSGTAHEAYVRLTQLNGATLYKERVSLHTGENQFRIPVSHLNTGVYFVDVYTTKDGYQVRHGWGKINVVH